MEEHIKKIEAFIQANDTNDKDVEFECLLYEVSDAMKAQNVGFEAVLPILHLMERHPVLSFGTPGALVHFVETFCEKGYEELLVESLKRAPTVHTLWMLNRLINGSTEEKAMEYIQLMKAAYTNESLAQEVRDTAKDFLEYQEEL